MRLRVHAFSDTVLSKNMEMHHSTHSDLFAGSPTLAEILCNRCISNPLSLFGAIQRTRLLIASL